MTQVGAIVLAAGASTRLGQPKQLLVLGGETLLERAVRVATIVCDPVVVVLGSNADLIRAGCTLGEAIVTVNENWLRGMGSSIASGMTALGAPDGVLLMTCDMPAVTPTHLRQLTASGRATASAYAGRRGVPAYFPASCFPQLRSLQTAEGARDLLKDAPTVELPFGELDIDTPADVERAKVSFHVLTAF